MVKLPALRQSGAVIGHWIMGYPLSFLSILGLLALSGVVINDSLVLVDSINQRQRAGTSMWTSVSQAGVLRFRPVILTSLTTFFGLLPLLSEKASAAQILIPMAISLGFGILFATAVTLVLVPTIVLVVNDIREYLGDLVGTVKDASTPRANARHTQEL